MKMRSRKNNTSIIRRVDSWNPRKVWLIKHYADGHYGINQEIGGHVLYSRFQRVTKAQIEAIFTYSKVIDIRKELNYEY